MVRSRHSQVRGTIQKEKNRVLIEQRILRGKKNGGPIMGSIVPRGGSKNSKTVHKIGISPTARGSAGREMGIPPKDPFETPFTQKEGKIVLHKKENTQPKKKDVQR